jgi:hypothetical protein
MHKVAEDDAMAAKLPMSKRAARPAIAFAGVFACLCLFVALLTTWASAHLDAQVIVLYADNANWYVTATSGQRDYLSKMMIPAVIRCVATMMAWVALSGVSAVLLYEEPAQQIVNPAPS